MSVGRKRRRKGGQRAKMAAKKLRAKAARLCPACAAAPFPRPGCVACLLLRSKRKGG